jgi:hypothetical protein
MILVGFDNLLHVWFDLKIVGFDKVLFLASALDLVIVVILIENLHRSHENDYRF